MNKVELNHDVASPLVEKLIKDTYDKKITWERQELDNNVEIPEQMAVPLTTAHGEYHFAAQLDDSATVHFQRKNGLYFVWLMDDQDSLAYFSSGLYSMPKFVDQIFELSKAIRILTHDDKSIVGRITSYLNS